MATKTISIDLEAYERLRKARLLPVVALGEYLEGFDDPGGEAAQALIATLDVLDVTAEVAAVYASTVRRLRKSGQLLGGQ